MPQVTRKFFTLAIDSTKHWAELPEHATRAFSLYLIMDGEATHCCSMTPSSWGAALPNVFSCPESSADALNSFLNFSDGWEYEGLEDSYLPFICWNESRIDCSKLIEVSIDLDSAIDESEPLPESVMDALWIEARDNISGNPYLPMLCTYESEKGPQAQ